MCLIDDVLEQHKPNFHYTNTKSISLSHVLLGCYTAIVFEILGLYILKNIEGPKELLLF